MDMFSLSHFDKNHSTTLYSDDFKTSGFKATYLILEF